MMMKLNSILFCALGLAVMVGPAQASQSGPGPLLMVGGALADDNDAVYAAFIAGAAGAPDRPIFIVPAATGSPAGSAARFREQLTRRGVVEERIQVLPLAVMDDRDTPKVDESRWVDNGGDPKLAELARTGAAFWFVGGDQARIAKVLLTKDGEDTAVLAAIRAAHAEGAMIGGSSAGTAIMSDPMILGGDSLGALSQPVSRAYAGMEEQESGGLVVGRGLGFFNYGMVDQHFDRKARQGRLVVALREAGLPRGFGVDEDTALLVDPATGTGEVVGRSGVTILDVSAAQWSGEGEPLAVQNVRVSLLSAGDRVALGDGTVVPGAGRKPTAGHEYFNVPAPGPGGVFGSYGEFADFVNHLLVDNRGATVISSLAVNAEGEGYRVRFIQDEQTKGYWVRGSVYTTLGVRMDLEPVRVLLERR